MQRKFSAVRMALWCLVGFVACSFTVQAKQRSIDLGRSDVVVVDENDMVHRASSKLTEKSFEVPCRKLVIYTPNNACPKLQFQGISYNLFEPGSGADVFRAQFIKETLKKMMHQGNATIQAQRKQLVNAEYASINFACTRTNKTQYELCTITFLEKNNIFSSANSPRYVLTVPKCKIRGVQKTAQSKVTELIAECQKQNAKVLKSKAKIGRTT